MKSLIINSREYGFFSSMFQVIDNLKYCELNNIKPILAMGEKFLYQNNNTDKWGAFFEHINDGVVEEESIEITQLSNCANFLMENYMMDSPLRGDYHLKLWTMHCENNPDIFSHRTEICEMMKKYLVPKEEIRDIINIFYETNLKSKRSLACHIRGTDYTAIPLNRYIEELHLICSKHHYEKIFVAADSVEAIEIIRKAMPYGLVCSYDTSIRSEKYGKKVPVCHTTEGDDKIKHGIDVLIEVHLLSKCDHIVCINSNVAGAAAYLNPSMEISLLSRVYGGG